MTRSQRIIEAALSGLLEYYACLGDATLCKEIEASVKVPDTGNDQLDYETVRDRVERICKLHESPPMLDSLIVP